MTGAGRAVVGAAGFGRTASVGHAYGSGRTAGSGRSADSRHPAGSGRIADSGRTADAGRIADSGHAAGTGRTTELAGAAGLAAATGPAGTVGLAGLQQPDGLRPGFHRRGLAPVAGVPYHRGTRPLGGGGGPVIGAVIHDDHDVNPGQAGRGGDGLADPVGLVPGRDDHGDITGRLHGCDPNAMTGRSAAVRLIAAAGSLRANHRSRVVEHGEDALEPGYLQDLPDRRAGPGEFEVAAALAGAA